MKSKKPIKNRYKGALRPGSENYMYGGYEYMYGGEYAKGGWIKDVGSFAYGTLEGTVDTLTMGLTDPLTDKGYDALQKAGNKKLDLSNPEDLKELEDQNKFRGAGEIAGAIAGSVVNPAAAMSGVGEGLEGANRIIQNSDVSDKTRKIANISTQIGSTATGIASGSGLAEGIAPFAKTADQLNTWMNIGKGVQVGSQFLPQGNDLASQARAIQAENDAIAGLYPDANVQYYGKGGKLSNKIGKLRREGYPQDQAAAIAYSMMERNELGNGGYVVSKSDRKGKTHKVTGPDGSVKHFGDPNLKNRPNNPGAKKSWYARHKKNLDKNPHFRAYARATWAEGGMMDTEPKTYTVSDADKTFYGIANKLGINKQDFVDANPDVNIDRIKPGMVLNMPLAMPTPVKDALPQSVAAELLLRQAFKESSFIPTAESPKQYKGLGQIGDAVLTDYMTATGMKDIDLFNPEQNMAIQKWYMDDLYNRDFIKKEGVDQLDDIRLAKALAAYNWGPTYLSNFLNAKKSKGQDIYKSFDWVEDLPTETRDYVHKILLKDIPSFEEEYANALADQQYKDIITLYIPDYFKRDIQPAAFNIDSVPNKNDFLIRPNPVDNTAVSMPVEKLSRGGWLSKYEMGGNIQDNTYSQGGWLNKYK